MGEEGRQNVKLDTGWGWAGLGMGWLWNLWGQVGMGIVPVLVLLWTRTGTTCCWFSFCSYCRFCLVVATAANRGMVAESLLVSACKFFMHPTDFSWLVSACFPLSFKAKIFQQILHLARHGLSEKKSQPGRPVWITQPVITEWCLSYSCTGHSCCY